MKLFLSYWDSINGPKIFFSLPKQDPTSQISKITQLIFQKNQKSGCFKEIISIEEANHVNYIFQVPSEWHKDHCETLMLTGSLDEHENFQVFKQLFTDTIEKLKKLPTLYKAFYTATQWKDPQVPIMEREITQILTECFNNMEKSATKERKGLADIIILGIQAVGKTSIINRVISGKFSDQVKPTLAPQILKMMYERIDMRVYDMGGQAKLRKMWETSVSKPQGIVYVLDCTSNPDLHQDSINEFTRMMKYYFGDPTKPFLPLHTPVLLLANKKDLNPYLTIETVQSQFHPEEYKINFKIGLVSAKTGEGLEENFQWFAKGIKVTKFG
jgi:GTPase SAR1 family protein